MKLKKDGCTLLGEGIVKQAADDYLEARETLYKIENGLYSYLTIDEEKDITDISLRSLCKKPNEGRTICLPDLDDCMNEICDYEKYLSMKLRKIRKLNDIYESLKDCIGFFNSEYYRQLTPLDSSVLLRKLDDAFEEYKTSEEFKNWKKTYDRKHKKKK